MSTPQQPELARSGRGASDPKSAKSHADAPLEATGPEGPIPADNAPGHHPAVEQDKPAGPPPRPRTAASKEAVRAGARAADAEERSERSSRPPLAKRTTSKRSKAAPARTRPVPVTGGPAAELSGQAAPGNGSARSIASTVAVAGGPAADLSAELADTSPTGRDAVVSQLRPRRERRPTQTLRFPFAFERRVLPLSMLAGVVPLTSGVELDADTLRIRFGLWKLTTPLDNVAGVSVTGPYQLLRVAGPPHLSLSDSGITFATNTRRGVCVSFHEPVPAALPVPLLRHGAATVTVVEPDAFADALRRRMTM
jgi:hypothetical protein